MLYPIAIPYKFHPEVKFIVDYLRNKFNIIEYNKMNLSLKDAQGNEYLLFNDPNKVYGHRLSGIEFCPDIIYDESLIDIIKSVPSLI